MKIALMQLLPEETVAAQLRKATEACRQAKKMGADITLFPEMWSTGYRIPEDESALGSMAVRHDSPFLQHFSALAEELQMAIVMTCLEAYEDRYQNALTAFDRYGEEVLHYAKVHTCAFEAERVFDPGEGFHVADLDLGEERVRIGAMICFDREFPESARILMLKGAEVILVPNACPMEINRLSALRTRAYENMMAVATCNYPKGQPDCNGHSTVFDGVAWLREESGVRDMCVFEALEEEGIYLAEIDLKLLRTYREGEVMGWKYRHPEAYGILTERMT